ncbi:MAG: LysM peptidoglycan-binding domain-containing protein [Anaerolineales bacterium]|nr:LysM peptidoglycan-binding domain-containing protein [Anaerolineales bacterium]
MKQKRLPGAIIALIFLLSACAPLSGFGEPTLVFQTPIPFYTPAAEQLAEVTPNPTRPAFSPGELVEYIAQTGDTLPALAAHFDTSVEEIAEANPDIPRSATTLPQGMPMQIPIYYRPYWGTSYQIIPDNAYINGPDVVGFDTQNYLDQTKGWLKDYTAYASGQTRTGAQIVDLVATNFSISPRVLLAILEYQAGAISQPLLLAKNQDYPLGIRSDDHKGVYLQLVWAANRLNNGYYRWRVGDLSAMERPDNRTEQPDPWQNAATAAFQYYFIEILEADAYDLAISYLGIAKTYQSLFGDPWQGAMPHIPVSLEQPEFRLPFAPGEPWAFTGAPHTGWGKDYPLAALDFAPPSDAGGCVTSNKWVLALADGLVVRTGNGELALDLDMDGDERTGWVVFYLHLATREKAQVGDVVLSGERVGHPSCEGGSSTGTHVHLARKYNGEWISANGVLAFNMEGWEPVSDGTVYEGSLVRYGSVVEASPNATSKSIIYSQWEIPVLNSQESDTQPES